jgi:hypothetical protein
VGKFWPKTVIIVPPAGLRLAMGLTDATLRGKSRVLGVANGICPNWSVTTGYQEPATGITLQVKVLDPVTVIPEQT